MSEEKPIIAERIKFLRKEKGYTQEQLAELLGLNAKSSIANYESGANAPSDEIKTKLCKLFDCSMDYLMGDSEYRNSEDVLDKYLETQITIAILKCFNEYHYKYVIPCNINEKSLDKLTEILLSAQKGIEIEQIRNQLKKFYNSFPKNKQDTVKKFVKIIIKEIVFVIDSFNTAHALMSLVEKDNDLASSKIYMCPVYRSHICWNT